MYYLTIKRINFDSEKNSDDEIIIKIYRKNEGWNRTKKRHIRGSFFVIRFVKIKTNKLNGKLRLLTWRISQSSTRDRKTLSVSAILFSLIEKRARREPFLWTRRNFHRFCRGVFRFCHQIWTYQEALEHNTHDKNHTLHFKNHKYYQFKRSWYYKTGKRRTSSIPQYTQPFSLIYQKRFSLINLPYLTN